MAAISVKHQHQLSDDEVRGHIDELARKLANELDAGYRWEGNVLRFERSGASGVIELKTSMVEINVKLGMLLRPFRGKVEQSINDYLDQHIS